MNANIKNVIEFLVEKLKNIPTHWDGKKLIGSPRREKYMIDLKDVDLFNHKKIRISK